MIRIFFLMMLAGAANANNIDDNIAQKCMSTAKNYAMENGGQPWSEDAEFITTRFNTCIVRVSQVCDQLPHQPYNKHYIIDMRSWTVQYFEVDGCVNWP